MKILIADHDDQSRGALQEFLLQQGHDVVVAATGDEVWQGCWAKSHLPWRSFAGTCRA